MRCKSPCYLTIDDPRLSSLAVAAVSRVRRLASTNSGHLLSSAWPGDTLDSGTGQISISECRQSCLIEARELTVSAVSNSLDQTKVLLNPYIKVLAGPSRLSICGICLPESHRPRRASSKPAAPPAHASLSFLISLSTASISPVEARTPISR